MAAIRQWSKYGEYIKLSMAYLLALLLFSFFILFLCHFHLICRFFFQRLELLFMRCFPFAGYLTSQ